MQNISIATVVIQCIASSTNNGSEEQQQVTAQEKPLFEKLKLQMRVQSYHLLRLPQHLITTSDNTFATKWKLNWNYNSSNAQLLEASPLTMEPVQRFKGGHKFQISCSLLPPTITSSLMPKTKFLPLKIQSKIYDNWFLTVGDGRICSWDLNSATLLHTINCKYRVHSIQWWYDTSSNRLYLIEVGADDMLYFRYWCTWNNTSSKDAVQEQQFEQSKMMKGFPKHVVINTVIVGNGNTGNSSSAMLQYPQQQQHISIVNLLNYNEMLTCDSESTIILWQILQADSSSNINNNYCFKKQREFKAHFLAVYALAGIYRDDSCRIFASTGSDASICLWKLDDNSQVSKPIVTKKKAHKSTIKLMLYSQLHETLVTCDNTVHVWKLDTQALKLATQQQSTEGDNTSTAFDSMCKLVYSIESPFSYIGVVCMTFVDSYCHGSTGREEGSQRLVMLGDNKGNIFVVDIVKGNIVYEHKGAVQAEPYQKHQQKNYQLGTGLYSLTTS